MPLDRTYIYNYKKITIEKVADGYARTITFSLWMVVLNQLKSHSLVLHRSFTGFSMAFEH